MLKRIQGLLQWCFVKVEGLFNLAFGEKLNPLYHIGQISYYLMWLIVASGLYLRVLRDQRRRRPGLGRRADARAALGGRCCARCTATPPTAWC